MGTKSLMVPSDDDSVIETLDIVSDAGLVRAIREGLRDADEGRVCTHAEVLADLRQPRSPSSDSR
jgi:predicted transcriptional regulator